jgi:hypothetical protein
MREANLPSFKEHMLLEYSAGGEDNITAGLRQVVSDIKTGWRSAYNDVEREHKKALKKLSPDQHRKILAAATQTLQAILRAPKTTPNMTTFVDLLRTKDEAAGAYTTFTAMSSACEEMHKQFQRAAQQQGIITAQEADRAIAAVKAGQFANVGPNNDKFITSHSKFITDVLTLDKTALTLNIDGGADLLERKLMATPADAPAGQDRKTAVSQVYYTLLTVRRQLAAAASQIHSLSKARKMDTAPVVPGAPVK